MRGLPVTFWYLWVGALVNRLGGFVFIYLSLYLTDERGFTVDEAGLVVALWGVGGVVAGPVAGLLADRFGRRSTLIAATVLGAAAMLQLGLARGGIHIAASALLLGFFGELYRPPLQAAIADVVAPEDRTRAYGYVYWAVNLGFSAAAIVAGLIAHRSWFALFVGDAATTLVFGVIVAARVPETHPAQVAGAPRGDIDFTAPYRDTALLTFVALQLCVAMVFFQGHVALPLDMRAHGLSTRAYGLLIAINGVMIVLLQPIAVGRVGRYRRARVLALGALLTGIGFGMNALAASAPLYALSIVIWTTGEIIFSPVTPTVVADLAPPALRGSYQGALQASFATSTVIGPAIGSMVMRRFGGGAVWIGCGALATLAALLHVIAGPARRRRLVAMGVSAGVAREDGRPAIQSGAGA